jgi:folate-dependent tRNA-U54 methylase TrmFO/GidA
MQNVNFYRAINPIERAGSEPLNELKVSVRYDKGGINYFNYKQDKRGVYVHFQPVHRGNGFESATLLGSKKESGFKMFVRELGRMSQKQMDDVAKRIEPMIGDFADKWNKEDWQGIYQQVMAAM